MNPRILDGKAAAADVKAELAQRVAGLKARGIQPGLGTILVGDDPASHAYVAGKHRDCDEVGVAGIHVELPATATQADVEAAVAQLNADPTCTGYIVQLPLPRGLQELPVLQQMDPAKDADGLHPTNLGLLVTHVNDPLASPVPCTPRGVLELLQRNAIELRGKHIVVVGRSILVGRSLALLASRKEVNATVTQCHTGTTDIGAFTRQADIVVAAVGVPGFITAEMVSPGAVLVDVGINRVDDASATRGYRLVGDIADDANAVSSAYSPVPGGVGFMTRAMLLQNVVEAAERQLAAADR